MAELPDGCVDAVITDPPYGTGWVRGGASIGVFHAKHEKPDWDVFSTSWIRPSTAHRWAVFCPMDRAREVGSRFAENGLLHYRKTNPRPNAPPCEAVVTSFVPWEVEELEHSAYNGDSPLHPCQKPEGVMVWLIRSITEQGETILDPFLGSGTTAVAAKKLGRHFLGFEISEEYCRIARERIALVEAQPNLFEQVKITQQEFEDLAL